MDSMISWIMTAAATVVSSTVLFFLKRFFGHIQKKEEQHELAKAQESILVLRSLNALGKLTVANAIALKDGKTNGELSAALREYEAVERELYQYLVSHYAQNLP
ncbi:MAG: hypothetical protein IJX94_06375 [Clostridia bacterium]|nr:hypothetical protein [Clostridia bacterium]